MHSAACLDDNQAAEFATGALPATEAAGVEQHLAGCRDCRSLVAALAAAPDDDSDLATSPRGHAGPGHVPTMPATPGTISTFSVGDRIGRYVVLGRLGQGGMGVVLSAYDPQLDRKVAIKLLRAGVQITTTEGRARMVREAKAIAQLSHPNVVAVYDVGTAKPGDVYIAMEFVEGDTLNAWHRKWERSWRDVLDVFLQAGRGLAAAHGAGLLHRDFKPDNVLVGADGRVRVGDFGLARSFVGGPDDGSTPAPVISAALAGSLTATGTIVGTPRYMAPETLRGGDSDARSDQFSFCVALYEALYGRHPFEGETAVVLIEGGRPATPPPEGTKVPASVGRAVLRGLEDVPSRRFPAMAALIAELTPQPVRAPRRIAAAAAVAMLAAGAAGAAVMSRNGTHELPASEREQLTDQIAVLKALVEERQRLIDELTTQLASDQAAVTTLRSQIKAKDHQIEQLLSQLEVIMPRDRPAKPRPARDGAEVIRRLRNASADLRGCFLEWSERRPATDTRLRITMAVTPTGTFHAAQATGPDSSLSICVTDALRRVPIEAPGQKLQLGVSVLYTAGIITIDPEVLTAGPADGGTIDLGTPASSGRIDL